MMNITILCKTLLKGGTEKQVLVLSKLLTEQKNDVSLVIWSSNKIDPQNFDFIKNNSIKYFALKGNPLKKFSDFIRIIKNGKTTFILSYLTLPNIISGISRFFVTNIIRIGGIRNEKLPYYKFLFERCAHNHLNDATVFNNYSAKEKFIKRGFESNKIFVIQNAISPVRVNGNEKEQRSDVRIVTVSRFVKQKDFRTALYSFNKLINNNKDKDLNYYLIGYGPGEQKIRSLSEDLNIRNRVKLFINPSNKLDIMTGCDIYLSTSLFEGLSNSIMEAMAVGLPIIATDVGDNKYLVKDGFNGYLIPCKDVDGIAEKLTLLSKSEDLRNDFGKKSRLLIEDKFSQEKFLEHYLNLFSEFQHN